MLLSEREVRLLVDSQVRGNLVGGDDGAKLDQELAWVSLSVSMFTKVTRDYRGHSGGRTHADVQSVIESTVGQFRRRAGEMNVMIKGSIIIIIVIIIQIACYLTIVLQNTTKNAFRIHSCSSPQTILG